MNTQLTIFALAIFLFATCSRGKVIDFFYSIKARKRTFFLLVVKRYYTALGIIIIKTGNSLGLVLWDLRIYYVY